VHDLEKLLSAQRGDFSHNWCSAAPRRWASGTFFHISFQGDFETWIKNPLLFAPNAPTTRGVLHFLFSIGLAVGPPSASSLFSFLGGLDPFASSLFPSDMLHHHLAIGVLFMWFSQMEPFRMSFWILKIPLFLGILGTLSNVGAHHAFSMAPFLFIHFDATAQLFLFTHHTWIGASFTLGAFSHLCVCLPRRRQPHIAFIPASPFVSHLSWVSLWLGFHVFGLFVHNDVLAASMDPCHQFLFRPVLAEYIQLSFSWADSPSMGSIGCLGPGDFFAHHSIALGLHTPSLILLKGCFDAQGSRHMPDKGAHGFGFACDGPGKGGSCDISSWDSAYLASFWVLNTQAWTLYSTHWKLINCQVFQESSTTLAGWFRDYLWYNCSFLIRGYSLFGAPETNACAWSFLLAHLAWATGFMFLLSWRGYWQEVIEILGSTHLSTPILSSIWKGSVPPVALSIVQARCVGLAHFSAGFLGTYSCFLTSS
jgi:photosystem I P700 chlorophyll a apoprotein A2